MRNLSNAIAFAVVVIFCVAVAARAVYKISVWSQQATQNAEIQHQEAEKAKAARYRALINASVFKSLQLTEETKPWLKDRWPEINELRIKAAELAIDQTKCGKVADAIPVPAVSEIGSIHVICEGGHGVLYRKQMIEDRSEGWDDPKDEHIYLNYWEKVRQERFNNCMAAGVLRCHL